MSQFPSGQTLLIDADDTLWENNVYFERSIAAFISYLNHHEYSPAQVRQELYAQERETILTHGYGLTSFAHSLVAVFEKLSPEPLTEHNIQRVRSFARTIADQEIELLAGVADTLAELLARQIRPFEVPITYRARSREAGKKITWKDGVAAVWLLTRIRVTSKLAQRRGTAA